MPPMIRPLQYDDFTSQIPGPDYKPKINLPSMPRNGSITKDVIKPVTTADLGTVFISYPVEINSFDPSMEAGQEVKGPYETLNGNEESKVGDILRINYTLKFPFLKDWQKGHLISKWSKDERVKVLHVAYWPEASRVTLTVKVLIPFSPVLIIAVAIAAAVVGASIFFSVSSIERLVGTATTADIGGFKLSLAPLVIIIIASIFLIPILRR